MTAAFVLLVVAVEIVSSHALPEARVRAAIGDLAGRPVSRAEIRASLDRLWALHLFADVRVEHEPVPGGVRLRYRLVRRPWVEAIEFRGDLGLDVATLAAASGLALRDDASPETLARARRRLLERYRREGYADAGVEVETRVDHASNGRTVTFVTGAGGRVRVGEIRVHGTARLAPETIRVLFGVAPGDRYRADDVRAAVDALEDALRDRGFFAARATVTETRPHPGSRRIHLDLTVQEGGHTRIEFAGVTAIAEPVLRARVTFADARVVDALEVRASARQVAAAYRDQGHAFAEVTPIVTRDGDDRVVRFRIDEGPRVRVASIGFTGDTGVRAGRLRDQMTTQARALLTGGVYRPAAVEGDVLALRGFLESEGFPDARVGPAEVAFSDDRTEARITVPVSAGPRVTVGAVELSGLAAVTRHEALETLGLTPGAAWSRARSDEARRALERLYARRGHHAAEVAYEARRRDGVVDLAYRVREGERTRIGRVLLEGLVLTRPRVVERELPFRAGDPFDPDALVEAQRRLGTLGPFDRVDVDPLRPPPAPFADVRVAVRERRPWHADVGLGYTTFEGARAFVELGHGNILGTARTATGRHRVSERGDRSELRYGEPRVAGTRWDGSAELFRERREELGFALERQGGALGIRRDLFPERIRGLRTVIRYEISQVDRFDVDPTLATTDIVRGRERIATMTPEATLDRRDRPLDPSRGSFHLLSLRGGDLVLGSDADFLKARLETHWFFAWLSPTVVAVSARLGLAGPLRDSDALPIEERFLAGGSTTVRGYRENRLGPLDDKGNPTGGNALAVFNVEWRFPIWRWLGGAVFVDTGAVASEVARLAPGDLKTGIGAGLRVVTPVGPLRLDAGYPLDSVAHQEPALRFYVSVGHAF